MKLNVTKAKLERTEEVKEFCIGNNARSIHMNDVDEIDSSMPYIKVINMDGTAEIFPLEYYKVTLIGSAAGTTLSE